MDKCFRYNAHQSIMNMVIVFIITVGDHLITRSLFKVIKVSQQITGLQDSVEFSLWNCREFFFTCKNTGNFGNVNNRLVE